MQRKIVIGIGGSSGSIYARILLDKLTRIASSDIEVAIVMSDNARINWKREIGESIEGKYPFQHYGQKDFYAPFASGSSRYDTLIICPCSMGLLARIANGISDNLITRAADVMLKEGRKLILVPRETPFSLIHIKNMERIILAGGQICPAIPSYYSLPQSIDQLASTVVDRVLDLADLSVDTYRWGNEKPS